MRQIGFFETCSLYLIITWYNAVVLCFKMIVNHVFFILEFQLKKILSMTSLKTQTT